MTQANVAKASALPLRELLSEPSVLFDASGCFAEDAAFYSGKPARAALAGAKTFFPNSFGALEVLSLKSLQYAVLARARVPIPLTRAVLAGKRMRLGKPHALPANALPAFVLKKIFARGKPVHRGLGIKILRRFREPSGESELVQEFVYPPRAFKGFVRDARLVLVGDKIAACYARRAKKPLLVGGKPVFSSERVLTNAVRGGVVEKLGRELERACKPIAFHTRNAVVEAARQRGDRAPRLDFCVVDFLFAPNGEPLACEVEPVPDLRACPQAVDATVKALALYLRASAKRAGGGVYVNGLNYLSARLLQELPEAILLMPRRERALLKKFEEKNAAAAN